MKKLFALSFMTLLFLSIPVVKASAETEKPENNPDDWRKYYFELSFGNSVLFFDQSVTSSSGDVKKQTLPVSSFLFLGQWRASKHFALAAAWLLPYTTVKRVSGSNVSEKFVAPSSGAGISGIIYTFNIFENTYLEPECAALILRTYKSTSSKGDFFYPAGVFRLNISRSSGMNLYMGVSQAPAKKATALIYGIGQRF
jgi:hypothetical protein